MDLVTDLLEILGAAVTIATIVVRLTPSQCDNVLLDKVLGVLDRLSLLKDRR